MGSGRSHVIPMLCAAFSLSPEGVHQQPERSREEATCHLRDLCHKLKGKCRRISFTFVDHVRLTDQLAGSLASPPS